MPRTSFHIVKSWLLEALEKKGGRCGLHELVEYIELIKGEYLLPDDHLPQKGHPKDTQFKYYCRWAITSLRDEGLVKRGSHRGIVELEPSIAVSPQDNAQPISPGTYQSNSTSLDYVPPDSRSAPTVSGDQKQGGHQPWLRQELEKLLPEDRWDDVLPHEKTHLLHELEARLVLSNPDRDESWRISMAKAIFKRVQDIAAGRYPKMGKERIEKPPSGAEKTASSGTRSYYHETCGQLLEQYVREHFVHGMEYSRDEIATWFAERYPLFKPITVQCHIEKYTTNYRSRVHYNAKPEHDLLLRVNNDWNRIRLYQPNEDPVPIYQLEQHSGGDQRRGQRNSINVLIRNMIADGVSHEEIIAALLPRYQSEYGNKRSEEWMRNRILSKIRYVKGTSARIANAGTQLSISIAAKQNPVERHRSLLAHLSRFGELTQIEQQQLGLQPEDLTAWLDSLMVFRPHAMVASPLFLCTAEGDTDPVHFTTRLAIRMTGDCLDRAAAKIPMDSIESYVWERFGRWHLPQPHLGDAKRHGYLNRPVTEPADLAESEKLDLFAHLPPLIISELVRDSGFLNEQQGWSAQASIKGNNLGGLSRQMNLGFMRPIFLSEFDLTLDTDAEISLGDLPVSEVLCRVYVVAGLPLCTGEEWQNNLRLSRVEVAERILSHPLYAAIVQFEVHGITAKLSGKIAATIRHDPNGYFLEINGNASTPLWLACRTILGDLGFWPVTASNKDAAWESSVRHAVANLEKLGILECRASEVRLCDAFTSSIKAHPAHPQNRGEKSFRVRLAQYLEKASRGVS